MRTIKVTGKGRLKLRPDTTRLTLTLGGAEQAYDAALERSAEETRALASALASAGFARTDLKTLSFSVQTEYEGFEESGVWKQRFAGYRWQHVLRLEFDSSNERLGQVLAALSASPVDAELRIGYTVRDPDAAKSTLLGKAVADAEAKAEALAFAAGVTRKEIQSIDYSWRDLRFEAETMDALAKPMAAKARFDMDIEPDDIDVWDTVTVVWEIE